MRLTVVFIGTSLIELHGEGVALLSQLIRHGDSFLGHAVGDSIFVEDNIVWASLVVDPIKTFRIIDVAGQEETIMRH
jgi:hypothetical protein